MLLGDVVLSHATAFLVRTHTPSGEDKIFLVTNWHNVSGKHRDGLRPVVAGSRDMPNKIKVWFPGANGKISNFWTDVYDLYSRDACPNWLEYEDEAALVDVVAMQILVPEGVILFCVNDDLGDGTEYTVDMKTSIGSDVFVLGFPFLLETQSLPIWKRASIASEPSVALVSENPKFLIDTASRPGMSGSLVIQTSVNGIYVSEAGDIALSQSAAKIVGIYSGRIGVEGSADLQLGIVWPMEIVTRIITNGRTAKHPHVKTL
ncbi:MAG: hypothetical protein CFE33_15250 [Pseudorhodobacter sp. PARRP1]|nr:MAG: hypothetical protein CFE33_15250 [Pseudorhodobacter sp. PARRP1]